MWKLRHLPHLKCLVLSGNPIDSVFYHSEDRTDNTDAPELHHNIAGHCCESAVPQKASPDAATKEEKRLRCHLGDSDMDVNSECDSVVIGHFDQVESKETEETFEHVSVIDAQPVGRLGFHPDAESLAGSSSNHEQTAEIEFDSGGAAGLQSRLAVQAGLNLNANNKCRVDVKKCLCDAYGGFDEGYFLNDDVFLENAVLENANTEEENDAESYEWHRSVAEEFVNEIIDGINFDDILDQTVPEFPPSSYDQIVNAGCNLEDIEDSSDPDSISKASDTYSTESTPTKQQVSVGRSTQVCVVGRDHASTALEMDFGLGYSPVISEIDAQFIPRAVRLFDDEVMNSFFYMATPSPPRSRAQRCLFPEPVCNGSSHSNSLEDTHCRGGDHQAATDSCSDSHQSASDSCSDCQQSASDSCSDCEAEQHKQEKNLTGVSSNDGKQLPAAVKPCLPQPHFTSDSSTTSCYSTHLHNSLPERSEPSPASGVSSSLEFQHPKQHVSNCSICEDNQNVESNNNNNNILEDSAHELSCDHICGHSTWNSRPNQIPFQNLQVLCLSSANLHHWSHLKAFSLFPKLTSLRLKVSF